MKRLMLCLLLVGCGGGSAEAKDLVGWMTIKYAVVGDWKMCDHRWPMVAIQEELYRVTSRKIPFTIVYDLTLPDERPDLNTLDHFWDSSLGEYWRSRIPEDGGIRIVLLPPLQTPGGPMYGGMAYGKGPTNGWAYVQVGDNKYPYRVTYAVLHELGHIIGRHIDNCEIGRPSIMCYSDVVFYKANPSQIHYNAIQERQIRKRLGLRVLGKTLVIRG